MTELPRIVHLGLGNFHRAHQAWYTQLAGGWRICAVAMRNTALRDEMLNNNNTYALGIWDNDGLQTMTMDVHDEVLLATEQADTVICRLAERHTMIVSLTVTEKGYYLDRDTGGLDTKASEIKRDLRSESAKRLSGEWQPDELQPNEWRPNEWQQGKHNSMPCTAIGLLAAGINQRAIHGGTPLTILSCDNLAENGGKLKRILTDYMRIKHPDTLPWMLDNTAFPNSMVDRITPQLSATARAEILDAHDCKNWPSVGTEAFSEWIITDEFVSDTPDWTSAGVVVATDISSFEERKLRLLNAAHSYLAYAGLLAGYEFVHEAIADNELANAVEALWDEAAVTVAMPAAQSIQDYRSALVKRFAVPQMRHALNQIAMDGSLKLRERLIPTLPQRVDSNLSSPHTCRAIDDWMAYVQHAVNKSLTIHDPNVAHLMDAVNNADTPSQCRERLARLIGLQPCQYEKIHTRESIR